MEDALVLLDRPPPPAQLTATLALAADFARASKAKTTLAAYESDWRVFESLVRHARFGRAAGLASRGVWLPGG
jgi:hypothetical protein